MSHNLHRFNRFDHLEKMLLERLDQPDDFTDNEWDAYEYYLSSMCAMPTCRPSPALYAPYDAFTNPAW